MNNLIFSALSLLVISVNAQAYTRDDAGGENSTAGNIDTVAVMILDKMTTNIGGIDQACVDIQYLYDVNTSDLGFVKHSTEARMCVKGSDKLVLDINGDNGHRSLWYSGEQFSYYSWDKNQFAQVPVTGNTIDAIDSISQAYGVEFPGIDVFYPSFADDAVATCTRLSYLGQTVTDGKPCFHIAARNDKMSWQLWVSNDLYFLPVKLNIRYAESEGYPEYEFHYSNYDLNAGLPDGMFYFNPPPKAKQIVLKTK